MDRSFCRTQFRTHDFIFIFLPLSAESSPTCQIFIDKRRGGRGVRSGFGLHRQCGIFPPIRPMLPDLSQHLQQRSCVVSNNLIKSLQDRIEAASDEPEKLSLMLELLERFVRVDPREAFALAEQASELARRLGDEYQLGQSLIWSAYSLLFQNNVDGALRTFEQVREIFEKIDSPRGIGAAHHGLAYSYYTMGDKVAAMEHAARALQIRTETSDRRRTDSLNLMAMMYRDLGDPQRALDMLLQCQEIYQASGEEEGVAEVLNSMGRLYAGFNDTDRAMECFRQSLELSTWLGNVLAEAANLLGISNLYLKLGDPDASLEYQERNLRLCQASGITMGVAISYERTAMALCERGEMEPALEYLSKALAIAEEGNAPAEAAAFLMSMSNVTIRMGDPAGTIRLLQRALDIVETIEQVDYRSEIYSLLAAAHEGAGDLAESIRCHKLYRELREKIQYEAQAQAIATMEIRLKIERAEQQREIDRLRTRQLEHEMEEKSRELATMAMQLAQKNEFLSKLKGEMTPLVNAITATARAHAEKVVREINQAMSLESNWESFEQQFQYVHRHFMQTLAERNPSLTQTELKICALIKSNLSSKQIADFLCISTETVKTHRRRIRKKFALKNDANLASYITAI